MIDTARRIATRIWELDQLPRFMIIGSLNTLAFLLLFEILGASMIEATNRAYSISWFITWELECAVAQYLHRRFTFRSDEGPARSFALTMTIYTITGILSTITFDHLHIGRSMDHRTAWLITLCSWGLVNFVLFKFLAFRPETHDGLVRARELRGDRGRPHPTSADGLLRD